MPDSVLNPDEQIIYDFERFNELRLAEYELKHTIGAYNAFYQQELKTYKSEVGDQPHSVALSEEEEEATEEDADKTPVSIFDSSQKMNPYERKKDDLIHEFELLKVKELAEFQLSHSAEEYDDFYRQQLKAYVREIDPDYADEYFE